MTGKESVALGINAELKVEVDLSKLCFICNKNVDDDDDDHRRDCERYDESSFRFQEGVQGQDWSSVKILTAYILNSSSSNSKDRENTQKIQSEILSSFKNGKCSICVECRSRAGKLLELHLELEKIQMQILDVLKNLQDYLKAEMVQRDGDDLHSGFQDVLQREFMSRELSTPSQVQPGGLRSADNSHDNTSSLFYILPEPAPEVQSSRNRSTGNNKTKSKRTVAVECKSSDLEQMISGDLDYFQDALDIPEDVDFEDEDIKPDLNMTTTTSSLQDSDIDIDFKLQTQISADPGDKFKRRLRSTRKNASNLIPEETLPIKNDLNDNHSEDNDGGGGPGSSQEDYDEVSQDTKSLDKRRKRGWECDICLNHIPSKEMKPHLQSHPEFEKFYECEICPSPKVRLRPRRKRIYGTYKGLVWHYLRTKLNAQVRVPHNVRLPCIHCPEDNQSSLFRRAELCRHLYEIHHPDHKKLPCKKDGCPEQFYDPITRQSHFYQEHSATAYPCDQCELSFKSRPDLTKHLRNRHPKLEKCSSCPRTFKSKSNLLLHEKTHKEGYQQEMVECPHPQCSKMFWKRRLNLHFKTVHTEDKVYDGWLTCDLCKRKVKSKSSLDSHIQRMHVEVEGRNMKLFSCSSCPKQFKCRASLRAHVKSIHEDPDLVMCPQCPKMCRTHGLNRHIKQVHTRKEPGNLNLPQCQQCSKTFAYASDLKIHEESHRTERTFKCPVEGCSYAARYEKALKNHRRIHEEKKFHCQFCPKVFGFKGSLKQHESTHKKPEEREEEKVYSCQYCPRTFSMRYSLKDHEDAHRNERNLFQCPEPDCSYKGSNRNSLNAHKNKWHKEKTLKCQFCPKMFAVKSLLKIHEITHSKEKSFKCDVCEEAFRSRDGRYRHRKKVHPDVIVVKRSLAGVGIVNQEEKDQ